mmetsp:Transcript_20316/g.49369  ORF Transcript_20316/g.49369 Transcript_20316/m.49369 type:complete len:260 (-) Transcript_20316:692-1471(-)
MHRWSLACLPRLARLVALPRLEDAALLFDPHTGRLEVAEGVLLGEADGQPRDVVLNGSEVVSGLLERLCDHAHELLVDLRGLADDALELLDLEHLELDPLGHGVQDLGHTAVGHAQLLEGVWHWDGAPGVPAGPVGAGHVDHGVHLADLHRGLLPVLEEPVGLPPPLAHRTHVAQAADHLRHLPQTHHAAHAYHRLELIHVQRDAAVRPDGPARQLHLAALPRQPHPQHPLAAPPPRRTMPVHVDRRALASQLSIGRAV